MRTEAEIEGGALVIDTVWMAPTEYNVEDCTFTQTTAIRGGAIYYGISGGADIGKASVSTSSGTMKGLTFDSCFAAQAAGAAYFDDVDVDMDEPGGRDMYEEESLAEGDDDELKEEEDKEELKEEEELDEGEGTHKGDKLKHSGKGRGEKKGDEAFKNEALDSEDLVNEITRRVAKRLLDLRK